MQTLALIGFLGGLITGISPCILPVLPVIFFSGVQNARPSRAAPDAPRAAPDAPPGSVATEVRAEPTLGDRLRPYRVIAGLVLSFSVFTLAGSLLLSLLHLPQDAVRWVGLVVLTLIGLGLIFPSVERLLERPFSRIPQRQVGAGRSGFGLGLALGVLYVPCAGPVLAAIVVAGATGDIGLPTIVLTLSFAVGAALPLLVFSLAGRRIAERVTAFRRHERGIRITGGLLMIGLAVALVFNLPAVLQRAVPDYTSSLQDSFAASSQVRGKLDLGGIVNDQNRDLANCTDGATELESCGTAPDVTGIDGWLNTPGGAPVDLKSLRGKVVLIDFWAYSCINCQRSVPHVADWYDAYRTAGLEVIGIHTPEYAFERVESNVVDGAAGLGITYPVALDNSYSTWTNYRNRYWPAEYLIDASGTVRHIKFGEGDYDVTEKLIRQLLEDANPDATLPGATAGADMTPQSSTTPETYLGVGKMVNYGGAGGYSEGSATFDYPAALPDDSFAYRGRWTLDFQGATAESDDASIALDYHGRDVYLVVGGTGTVTVTRDGRPKTIPVSGPPTLYPLVDDDTVSRGRLDVALTPGLQAYSFTYG